MNKFNTGGPAFPRGEIQTAPGMTLRDYFASSAMQGLLAGTVRSDTDWSFGALAETAYNMADAMLEAKEQ
jgi:hypothetical protein